MTEADSLYKTIVGKYIKAEGVAEGKMMTAPALQYRKKVFVFFHDGEMCFKLGKDFDPATYGIQDFKYLSPFKNKAPMKAWFYLPYTERKLWDKLTQLALDKIRN